MRPYLIATVLLIMFCSCEEKSSTYATVSGSINTGAAASITVSNASNYSKEIAVNPDGTFQDTIKVGNAHVFNLKFNRKNIGDVYLKNGYDLKMVIHQDSTTFKTDFTGKGSEINNYYQEKDKLRDMRSWPNINDVMTGVYPTDKFAKLMDKRQQDYLELLEHTQGLEDAFLAFEAQNINYSQLFLYSLYTDNGKQKKYATEPLLEPIATQLANLDYNNEQMYLNSQAYHTLCFRTLISTLYNGLEAGNGTASTHYLDSLLNTIHIERLKQGVIASVYERAIDPGKFGNTEGIYNVLLATSTDEEVRARISKHYATQRMVANGMPSPAFENYKNHAGGTTSLDDFKGKHVYIDVWATWCAPCKKEIPFLKEIEQKYHGKNIAFVSISVDQSKDFEKWEQMVRDMELGGVQLFADNSFKSQFIQEYGIKAIPRFILLDPKGNIVSGNALRPSNPKLETLFTELGI